jgi:hypothetical protein
LLAWRDGSIMKPPGLRTHRDAARLEEGGFGT